MGLKLSLNKEAATALKDFAKALPQALDNIDKDTQALKEYFSNIEDRLGVHAEAFKDILEKIATAQANAKAAIENLPSKMNETAKKIEEYIKAAPKI